MAIDAARAATPGGRLPPHDVEAEASVLGAILLDPTALRRVLGLLEPEDFYRENHGHIYRAALNLFHGGQPIDGITLGNELERLGQLDRVGGRAQLVLLEETVPTAANIEHYARIVRDKADRRRLISAAGQAAALGYDDSLDVADAIGRARAHLGAVARSGDGEEETAEQLAGLPEFPLRVLPQVVVSRLERAAQLGLPLDFLATAALATLAGALGGAASVRVAEEWSERPILWAGLVGQPGTGKSPSVETMAAPLRELQRMLFAAYEERRREWEELEPRQRRQAPRPMPERPLIGDTTVEALARQLDRHPATILIADELRGLLTSLGQYKRGGGSDYDRMLELWSGAPWAYQRATDDLALYVAEPTLTILGGIQPGRLSALGDGEDGLRARWLLVEARSGVEGDLPPLAHEAGFEDWDLIVRALFGLRDLPREWALDPDARAVIDAARKRWRAAGRSSEEPGHVRELQLKADRYALRLAVVLAESWRASALPAADEALRRPGLITGQVVEHAAALLEYFLAQRRAMRFPAVNLMSRPFERDRDRAVDQLAEWLEGRPSGRASRRDIQMAHVAGARTAEDIGALIERYAATFPGCVWQEPSARGPVRTVVVAPRRRSDGDAAARHPTVIQGGAGKPLPTVATVASSSPKFADPRGLQVHDANSDTLHQTDSEPSPGNSGNSGNSFPADAADQEVHDAAVSEDDPGDLW